MRKRVVFIFIYLITISVVFSQNTTDKINVENEGSEKTQRKLYYDLGIAHFFNIDGVEPTKNAFFISGGLNLNNTSSIGLCTGLDHLIGANIPIFLDFKHQMLQKKCFNIFFNLQSGYMVSLENHLWPEENKINLSINPSIKYIHWVNKSTGIYLGTGFRYIYLQTKHNSTGGPGGSTLNYYLKYANIRLGIYFN